MGFGQKIPEVMPMRAPHRSEPYSALAHRLTVAARRHSTLGHTSEHKYRHIGAVKKGELMQLDKKSLDRLLRLNDDQLRAVLGKLLAEYGVDVSRVPLNDLNIGALRGILQAATDEDITRFLQMFGGTSGTGQ